ncbi:MAG TPA: hypothetical protein PLE74_07835 [Candidatus Cloacimonadota bacterium]|nr:hypothetical protein [Candidatus Cloacimonadota bacterium]
MGKFERGITNKAFLDALNDLKKDPASFWSRMVADKDLFIAIRKESINVYFQGNSLAKITFDKNKLRCTTHYKFVINPEFKNTYFESEDDIFQIPKLKGLIVPSIKKLDLIKRAINVYSGEEKSGVHTISIIATNVLDVEIAIEKDNVVDENGRKSTDRIDFLRVEEQNDHLKLVFYEAKHYSNKEIRAAGIADPPVIKQLAKYNKSLLKHAADIESSYRMVCENLQYLDIIGSRNLISRVARGESITIDFDPRLVIFGYDHDQRSGKIWKTHIGKIKSKIGKKLITKGNPKSF